MELVHYAQNSFWEEASWMLRMSVSSKSLKFSWPPHSIVENHHQHYNLFGGQLPIFFDMLLAIYRTSLLQNYRTNITGVNWIDYGIYMT